MNCGFWLEMRVLGGFYSGFWRRRIVVGFAYEDGKVLQLQKMKWF